MEQKRSRTETFDGDDDDEDSERLAEENLRKLQSLAERASTSQKTPEQTRAGSSACAMSHWKKIGHLLLYTAAGVRGSSKVRHPVMVRNCILTYREYVSVSV